MSDKIRVGIIGLGRISSLHLPAYLPENDVDAELVAICDKSRRTRKEVAEKYGVEKSYKNYEDLLADNTIDAVEILTPHHLHKEMTLKAAEAGKHISLQKVPALTLNEMDEMIRATEENEVWFRVFENFRFYEPYQKAMQIVKEGKIGEVERVDYNMVGGINSQEAWKVPLKAWKWRISEKANYKSPTIFDDGYHKHSIMAMFLDNTIDSVMAWQGTYRLKGTIKLDTPTVIIYSCKNNARYGVWNTSTHDYVPLKSQYYACDEWVEMFGSEGSIWIPGCTGSWFEDQCAEEGPTQAGVHWIGKGEEKWHSIYDVNVDWADSFIRCSKEFIDAIKENRQPEVNPQDARYILKIGLAIIRSVRSNFKMIELKDLSNEP